MVLMVCSDSSLDLSASVILSCNSQWVIPTMATVRIRNPAQINIEDQGPKASEGATNLSG
jgi:hypothetical protein